MNMKDSGKMEKFCREKIAIFLCDIIYMDETLENPAGCEAVL